MYFLYILKCSDDTLYTGITNDLERRLKRHKAGSASRYTRASGAGEIVYTEEHPDRGSALKREAEIKRWRRDKKLALCNAYRK